MTPALSTTASGMKATATPAEEFFRLLNQARANPRAYGASIGVDLSGIAARPPLEGEEHLATAAERHSQDMNDQRYFGHQGSDGTDPGQRITAAGFRWTGWGESIAAGYADAASALKALITDQGIADLGHRRHLLGVGQFAIYGKVGIGCVTGAGPMKTYWTIDTAAGEPMGTDPITRLYRLHLGREPMPSELESWQASAQRYGHATVVGSIAGSGEARVWGVRRLYESVLGRTPSDAEIQGWVTQRSTLEEIQAALETSYEFWNRTT